MTARTHRLRIGNREWVLGDRTRVMGVLNVTPDSFSDGGLHLDPEAALARARRMAEAGADLIDVGGESTRPGADPVPAAEELRRVLPVIERLKREIPLPVSIDTTKHEVAAAAIAAGADLVNDIGGLRLDPKMAETVAEGGAGVILGHIRGTPATMQDDPRYADPVREVIAELDGSVRRAREAGIPADRILIDPGIGFGKRTEDNLALLADLDRFRELGCPIVIGVSRKSFLGRILDLPVGERLEGTLAAEAIAVMHGADILRTHEVGATVRAARVADALRRARDGAPAAGREP